MVIFSTRVKQRTDVLHLSILYNSSAVDVASNSAGFAQLYELRLGRVTT